MEPKPNQGMARPSLGGIGSRTDVGRAAQTCKHANWWRLADVPDAKVICGVCHPPASTLRVEWLV